ncbi:uncharacterized protein K452DRAFT_302551 [Aplosporella prunicola CBS 121167]|uniref:Uncharacterized protein n=1 Tax=Aplosporella prunicola CBS 121167 TaxID=1176127 RepID=A0A6A6B0Y4_9PEZI|nr:uncharacterized protein K452DRAFT_302551 [Aplosporella prunicola CBS 121167]KAF2136687.1 hypothetical protein K452DRAFT_302551 [Aplosporella prunicola CBS 121167]
MSYADIAAKGPQQSAEEVISSILRDMLVIGGGVEYAVVDIAMCIAVARLRKRRAPPVAEVNRTDDSVHSLVDVDSPHVASVPSDFESQDVQTSTQADRLEIEEQARLHQAEARAKEEKEKAKAKARRAGHKIHANASNPVVLGNAITVGVLGAALGFGAYRKYTAGQLSWKLAGAWAGALGLFGVADYYVSQYFFQKYPPKN